MTGQQGVILNGKIFYFANRAEAYRIYIRSLTWKKLRDKRVEIDGNRCRLCNSNKHLEVHHRVYPNIFGYENLEDLTTLCHRCHRVFTNIERRDKYAKREITTENVKRVSVPFKKPESDKPDLQPENVIRVLKSARLLGHNHDELPDLKPENYRRISSINALRELSQSNEQICPSDEENILKTGQNRI